MKCYNPPSFFYIVTVSIELPKYSIHQSNETPSFIKKALPVLMLICGLVFGYFGYKYITGNSLNSFIERNRLLEDSIQKDQLKIENLEIEISQLKAESQIKNEAVLQLQDDFKTQIDLQNGLESEINFYQQLLSPSTENKGLRIFDSKVWDLDNNNFNLDLTLVQKIQKAKIISGRYEVNILGLQENVQKSIPIHIKDESNYKFKYFHKISLSFSLPKGFKAEQLVVKLFPQNKKSKLIEHSVSWASHIQ